MSRVVWRSDRRGAEVSGAPGRKPSGEAPEAPEASGASGLGLREVCGVYPRGASRSFWGIPHSRRGAPCEPDPGLLPSTTAPPLARHYAPPVPRLTGPPAPLISSGPMQYIFTLIGPCTRVPSPPAPNALHLPSKSGHDT
ncbi:hypothetical protein B0H14DRAFT_3892932 [Mycena olivaceomarginata]|nr:hypothetical protein B0H14DRAFT_3892932 [Mycena olivaceomarginata]